jgi:hypothetical protein
MDKANVKSDETLKPNDEADIQPDEENLQVLFAEKIIDLMDDIENEFILNALSTMTLICMIEDFPNYAENLPLEVIDWLIKLKSETEDYLEENADKWAFDDLDEFEDE